MEQVAKPIIMAVLMYVAIRTFGFGHDKALIMAGIPFAFGVLRVATALAYTATTAIVIAAGVWFVMTPEMRDQVSQRIMTTVAQSESQAAPKPTQP